MKQKIFVGGTGRSGTTILAKILGQHPDVYSLPLETRFITDPDGLLSLHKSLYPEWSFFQADKAIERFIKMMNSLRYPYRGKYVPYGLSQHLKAGTYDNMVSDFIRGLEVVEFNGAWVGRMNLFQKVISKFSNVDLFNRLILENAYYLPPIKEQDFLNLSKNLLDKYYSGFKDDKDSKFVVDHTPSNIAYANSIRKIIPETKFIHIYRNPLDILSSFNSKRWSGNNSEINRRWVFDTLSKWNELKNKLPENTFIEIKFEDLINETTSQINKLCDFLEISEHEGFYKVDLSKHNIGRWKEDKCINISDIRESEKRILSDMGYNL